MYEKFGEFDSWEEINKAAQAQLEEGELDAIKEIAKENGLDQEDVEDFCTGTIEELTTPTLAAIGKLDAEAQDLKIDGALKDWKDFLVELCTEDESMSLAVRRKGKTLTEVFARILKEGFDTKARLDDRIVKAAGLKPPVYMGIPGKAAVRKIIREYYLEVKA